MDVNEVNMSGSQNITKLAKSTTKVFERRWTINRKQYSNKLTQLEETEELQRQYQEALDGDNYIEAEFLFKQLKLVEKESSRELALRELNELITVGAQNKKLDKSR